jgi:hypothetical protein
MYVYHTYNIYYIMHIMYSTYFEKFTVPTAADTVGQDCAMILKKKTQNTFAVAGYHHRSRSRFSPIPAPPLDAERLICVEGEAAVWR